MKALIWNSVFKTFRFQCGKCDFGEDDNYGNGTKNEWTWNR